MPEDERFTITHAHNWSVAVCFSYIEYLRELPGGAEKLSVYACLKVTFREGSPYISTGQVRPDFAG
jgi:hypothetical protein